MRVARRVDRPLRRSFCTTPLRARIPQRAQRLFSRRAGGERDDGAIVARGEDTACAQLQVQLVHLLGELRRRRRRTRLGALFRAIVACWAAAAHAMRGGLAASVPSPDPHASPPHDAPNLRRSRYAQHERQRPRARRTSPPAPAARCRLASAPTPPRSRSQGGLREGRRGLRGRGHDVLPDLLGDATARRVVLVEPVRRAAVLGVAVHLRRPNLHFSLQRADGHLGVQRAVAVRFGRDDEILERGAAARAEGEGQRRVYELKHAVADHGLVLLEGGRAHALHRRHHDDADRQHVVDLVDAREPLALYLAPDGVGVLQSRLD
eukprot:4041647-Prymnesium_polylepis.2